MCWVSWVCMELSIVGCCLCVCMCVQACRHVYDCVCLYTTTPTVIPPACFPHYPLPSPFPTHGPATTYPLPLSPLLFPHTQTKENLTLRVSSFGSKCDLTDAYMKKVANCGVIDQILSYATYKQSKELKKSDGSKRQRITGGQGSLFVCLAVYTYPQAHTCSPNMHPPPFPHILSPFHILPGPHTHPPWSPPTRTSPLVTPHTTPTPNPPRHPQVG